MSIRVLAVVILFMFAGCGWTVSRPLVPAPPSTPASNFLTTDKAQSAVDRFVSANGNGGRLRIRGGVREISAENAAVADLSVEDFESGNRRYSGDRWAGTAIFSKYSDGKWTLTEIKLTNARDYAWQSWKPIIEVR